MGKKKGGKQQDDYWDTEEVDKDTGEQAEAPAKPEPAKKAPAKEATKDVEDEDEEKEEKGGQSANAKKKAKKKAAKQAAQPAKAAKAAAAPASTGSETAEDAPATEDAPSGKAKPGAKKKGGLSKNAAAMFQKMKEEEEKRRKEEEEREKREEEEYQKRLEQEARDAEILKKKKEEKKIKDAEKKKKALEREKEAKAAQARERLLMNGVTIAAFSGNSEDAAARARENKKKFKKKRDEDDDVPVAAPTPAPVAEEPKPEPPKEIKEEQPAEEEPDDWETKDNWEDEFDEEKIKQKELEKKQAAEKQKALELEEKRKAEETKKKAEDLKKAQDEENKKAKANQKKSRKEPSDPNELRSPICCVLGHVDTGKTSLLDNIRRTNVQEGEAGGITQQIGATFFPMEALLDKTGDLSKEWNVDIKVPGLLIIDTPGHESFTNLRARGSSLCDIAILVVDMMHGLEPQTIESINLLKMKGIAFVVALNKVDRLYGWKAQNNKPIQHSLGKQDSSTVMEYKERVRETITAFAEQGLNSVLYYENKNFRKYVSLVPTSAHTGEGIPDLLLLLVQLTQQRMADKLLFLSNLQCTVLEVKVVEGLGTTIDVILVNGTLYKGDTIVVCGMNGPIVTTIRALLTPQPLKEIRVKGAYVQNDMIKAAMGIKIAAADLDKAVAGSSLLVAEDESELDDLKVEVMAELEGIMKNVATVDKGVYVQASTLGSLEALLEFLKVSKIPVSGINIGPVTKKDVTKASVMVERAKEYAVILAFDVKVSRDVKDHAEDMGVRIFEAEIIYHLFDAFTKYMKDLEEDLKEKNAPEAVFPCRLQILPEYIFNKKDPIVLGVEVLEGIVKLNTPIVVPSQEFGFLGRITSIERDHKPVNDARKGSQIAIKIENPDLSAQQKVYGRHFDFNDELVSRISRQSIDVLKQSFKDELKPEDVTLLAKLKGVFKIQ
eukprot:TRINITY_DN724_c0_g1_i2.p1 TRINITY_DN724_c0_g1~~TRINITY_DN724_c0_g1_i2.p1  ORF type:complete len:947 (-),score=411.76 TRINITY_DN724_c0_g1_i2:15-2855(-)